MNEFEPLRFHRAQFAPGGRSFSAQFEPGTHAVVAPSLQIAAQFLECAAGLRSAHRGSARWGSREAFLCPAQRAAVGILLPREHELDPQPQLPEPSRLKWFRREASAAPSVAQRLDEILAVRSRALGHNPRQSAPSAANLPLVEDLLALPAGALSPKQLRRVQLALCLSHPRPHGLLLYEPLSELTASEATTTLDQLCRRASEGSIVVFLSTSEEQVQRLAPRVTFVEPANDSERDVGRRIWSDKSSLTLDALQSRHVQARPSKHDRQRIDIGEADIGKADTDATELPRAVSAAVRQTSSTIREYRKTKQLQAPAVKAERNPL